MKKRIVALVLALVCLLTCLCACHDRKIDGMNLKGAEIRLYLNDMCYELDPALCYNNDAALQVCSLIYDTLFTLDENGKVQKSLVKDYEITRDEKNQEYTLTLTLRDDTGWNDGTVIQADDVVYAWKRILDPSFNSEAACLLYDIQNAKEAKAGDCSIDDVGISADNFKVFITFKEDIDYEAFLLNLTSVTLAPLREQIVASNGDWSKKPATTCCSGPFMLRRMNYGMDTDNNPDTAYASMILERNPYYRRTKDAKYIDTSVTPYRLIVDYSLSKENLLTQYETGEGLSKLFYIGDIALSQRAAYKDKATVTDLMSTHTYYFNENADIKKADGTTEKLFANKNVRLALSAVIDRQAIANAVVFAKAADALVPYGVFDTTSKKSLFRSVGGSLIATSADTAKAQQYLTEAGIKASDYSFSVMVREEDEVHMAIAEMVVEAWKTLGFNVTINKVTPEINDEKLAGEDVKDIFDDIFSEKFNENRYEVAAIDLIANAPTAQSFLAPFATGYSGQGQDMTSRDLLEATYHATGYNSETYTAKIASVYAEKDVSKKATLLHEAEAMLMEDMPVMPVIFNQSATLQSSELKNVDWSYFGFSKFTTAKLKNWTDFVETTAEEETPAEPAE